MTPATLTALSSELLEIAREHEITGHSGEVMQKAAAILEQVAGADAGCEVVGYLVCGGRIYKDQAVMGTLVAEDRVATRKDGSRADALIRQADHLAALTAQSGEGVALLRRLLATDTARQTFAKLDDGQGTDTDEGRVWLEARAAIAAYEAKRGGVRHG